MTLTRSPSLHINQVLLAYKSTLLFSNLSFTLAAGQWTGLLGPSGIGKSSLLRLIVGLTAADEKMQGEIVASNHIPHHLQIAYMGQTDLLLPWLTVLGNATLCLKLRNHTRTESLALRERALFLLEKVGLKAAASLYPSQLSGGMRQRVALVRTLMQEKSIVLMDEPFSALDAITRHQLQALAAELLKDKTVLFITHDPTEALRLAHHIYIMQGKPAALHPTLQLTSGTPRELTHADVINHQALLFHKLENAAQESL